jgi:hypothetical protein
MQNIRLIGHVYPRPQHRQLDCVVHPLMAAQAPNHPSWAGLIYGVTLVANQTRTGSAERLCQSLRDPARLGTSHSIQTQLELNLTQTNSDQLSNSFQGTSLSKSGSKLRLGLCLAKKVSECLAREVEVGMAWESTREREQDTREKCSERSYIHTANVGLLGYCWARWESGTKRQTRLTSTCDSATGSLTLGCPQVDLTSDN